MDTVRADVAALMGASYDKVPADAVSDSDKTDDPEKVIWDYLMK